MAVEVQSFSIVYAGITYAQHQVLLYVSMNSCIQSANSVSIFIRLSIGCSVPVTVSVTISLYVCIFVVESAKINFKNYKNNRLAFKRMCVYNTQFISTSQSVERVSGGGGTFYRHLQSSRKRDQKFFCVLVLFFSFLFYSEYGVSPLECRLVQTRMLIYTHIHAKKTLMTMGKKV